MCKEFSLDNRIILLKSGIIATADNLQKCTKYKFSIKRYYNTYYYSIFENVCSVYTPGGFTFLEQMFDCKPGTSVQATNSL